MVPVRALRLSISSQPAWNQTKNQISSNLDKLKQSLLQFLQHNLTSVQTSRFCKKTLLIQPRFKLEKLLSRAYSSLLFAEPV